MGQGYIIILLKIHLRTLATAVRNLVIAGVSLKGKRLGDRQALLAAGAAHIAEARLAGAFPDVDMVERRRIVVSIH